jgi:hypothetical protein
MSDDTKPLRLLTEQYESFKDAVGLRHASATQRREMKRAFFAGAWAYYSLVMNLLDPSTPDDTPQDLTLMAALDQEMRDFKDDVVSGKA